MFDFVSRFGFVSRKKFQANVTTLLGANGVDFNKIITKTRNLGLAKAEEAKNKRQKAAADQSIANGNFKKARDETQAIFQKAVIVAQANLKTAQWAVDDQYKAAKAAEKEAKKLTQTANYFS